MGRDLELYTRSILDLIANLFFVTKNGSYKNENEAWPSDLMGSSRWTIAMRRLFTNRRDQVLDALSTMESHDLSTSRKEEGA